MSRSLSRCLGIQGSRRPVFEHSSAFKGIAVATKSPNNSNHTQRSAHQSQFISEASTWSKSRRKDNRVPPSPGLLCLAGLSLKRLVHKMTDSAPSLETLTFDNLALRSLPVDPNVEETQRQVPGACFSKVKPTTVKNPSLVCTSLPALGLIDISEKESKRPEFLEYFSGNKILPGSETAAHCYCGHQFGYFSGQLGDGAAMYLGEVKNKAGERWEIQLKGAGKTPFSRTADGRKVLRSTIREFLCSEAINGLGISSTRAGACITSDTTVVRDIFYDGNNINERCTLVLRLAPTFLRFGSFEIFKSSDPDTGRQGPSVGRKDILTTMLNYTVETFYPEIWASHSANKATMYLEFYKEVVRRTARMVAHWQCVGWCHGVLNTDNMSIVGVTIDYGPYGFMDRYDPEFICNGSDDGGRYSYKKQPEMCRWNCMKLGEAIQDVVPTSDTKPLLAVFDEEFGETYKRLMRAKLGLCKELSEDGELVEDFLSTLQETGSDFTNCFRCLSQISLPSDASYIEGREKVLEILMSQSSSLEELKLANQPKMDKRQFQMFMQIAQTNPEILAQLGRSAGQLQAEVGRMERMQELEETTASEVEVKNKQKWNEWLDKYTARLKKEEEGVEDNKALGIDRVKKMNSSNPSFILRNYIAQAAIDKAEKGDYSEVQQVLTMLQSPYSDGGQQEAKAGQAASSSTSKGQGQNACHADYTGKPPRWASTLKVT